MTLVQDYAAYAAKSRQPVVPAGAAIAGLGASPPAFSSSVSPTADRGMFGFAATPAFGAAATPTFGAPTATPFGAAPAATTVATRFAGFGGMGGGIFGQGTPTATFGKAAALNPAPVATPFTHAHSLTHTHTHKQTNTLTHTHSHSHRRTDYNARTHARSLARSLAGTRSCVNIWRRASGRSVRRIYAHTPTRIHARACRMRAHTH